MSEEVSGNVKVLRIALAVLQNSVMGGVIFGWAAISGTILEASTKDGGAGMWMVFESYISMRLDMRGAME